MRLELNRVRRILRGRAFTSDRQRDIFLASYPRSGNTWLRAILFNARIGREPRNLREIDRGIPDEHYHIAQRRLLASRHPPKDRVIVKTHRPYQFPAPYRDVAYIVRDPRDVIPSFFRYLSRKGKFADDDFEDFAVACVTGGIWPGSWFEHASSWGFFESKHPDCISILLYERLVALDEQEIARLGKRLLIAPDVGLEALFRHYDLVL